MTQTLRVGDRIRVLEMTGDPDPIAPEEIGTVTSIPITKMVMSFGIRLMWTGIMVELSC